MVEGRQREAWDRTSSVMAMIANTARDKKTRPRPFQPADFNPFTQRRAKASDLPKGDIRVLKAVFVDGHKKRKGADRGKQTR